MAAISSQALKDKKKKVGRLASFRSVKTKVPKLLRICQLGKNAKWLKTDPNIKAYIKRKKLSFTRHSNVFQRQPNKTAAFSETNTFFNKSHIDITILNDLENCWYLSTIKNLQNEENWSRQKKSAPDLRVKPLVHTQFRGQMCVFWVRGRPTAFLALHN